MKPSHILIAGCSFSAFSEQSGWAYENLDNHYHSKILDATDSKITNIAIGGSSNFEIFQRTIENCIELLDIDFCIIQWSSLQRLWVYEAENNIDDFTQILPRVTGRNSDKKIANDLHKIFVNNYLNDYMALKQWLILQNSLQNFFKQQQIKYVFTRGFENYISDIEELVDQMPFKCIPEVNIPNSLKTILNFDDNPDDYLYKKISTLLKLYVSIDKDNCLGYNSSKNTYGFDFDFRDIKDFADDNAHPGKITNSLIADCLLKHIDRIDN